MLEHINNVFKKIFNNEETITKPATDAAMLETLVGKK